MTRKTYQLTATREGQWWIIDVPELDYRTQARKLEQVEHMGRDLIALMEDVPADSFDVATVITMPEGIAAQLDEASRLEREAREVAARAARDRRAAARALHDIYGLSAIEVAAVLGVTRARVYQLLDEKASA
ncbi:hypothetical protein OR221_3212 [Microbacterium laevaniformans OR221]|nr:hypothetical protein OR221_3212 [Microbacterium laevaniformans OR221]